MYRAEIFAASGMLDEIRESEQAEVLQNLKISSLKYRKGEMIFCTGDLMDKVCIVASGSVRSEKNYPLSLIHIFRPSRRSTSASVSFSGSQMNIRSAPLMFRVIFIKFIKLPPFLILN